MVDIETLEEILELLRITKEYILEKNRIIEPKSSKEMSTVFVLAIYNKTVQTVMLKSMVSDLEWFDSNQTKFKDWQRGIQLFFKNNGVIETDDKITTVLA